MLLKARFILAFGVVGVAFLLVISILVFYKMQLAIEVPLKQQFEIDAQSRIGNLNEIFIGKTKQFQSVARLPMFKSMRFNQLTLNKPAFKNDIRQMELYLLDVIKKNKEISQIRYINSKGSELFRVTSSGIKSNLLDLSNDAIIKQKLKLPVDDFEITDEILPGNNHNIIWWVPVYVSNTNAYGVLGFYITYKYFLENIADLVISDSEMICLFNAEGNELLGVNKQNDCSKKLSNLWEMEKPIKLKGLNWRVVLSVDPSSFFDDVREVKKFVFGLIFPIVAIIAFVFTTIFSGRIVKAIRQLVDASKIMGQGKTLVPIKMDRQDELGQLADQMNLSAKLIEANRAMLEEKNRDLESYSYTLAHDLRSPLRAITGFAQVLEMSVSEKLNEEENGYLDRIVNASKRMSELIDDILELSRISNKEVRVDDVSLSKVAELVVEQLRGSDNERVVSIHIDPNLKVQGDAQLLRLVLENLLGNAWKYSSHKEQAVIKFSAFNKDNVTIYCIADNGVGFDMQYVGKLFKPFQRLHANNEFEGTGIGLASVKRMIERHNGSIWIESVVDEGTSVYFTLWESSNKSIS